MIGKLAAFAAVLSCAFPAEAKAPNLPTYSAVKQVMCSGGSGSAFRIKGGDVISVAHVTTIGGCTIDGAPVAGVVEDGLDFAIIHGVPNDGDGFKVNCGGFIAGQYYFAVGFAAGFPWQTMTRILATNLTTSSGLVGLMGLPTVYPGMSGGVILNEAGEAVGTVNQYTPFDKWSLSRPLKDTSLCKS